ncbi:hypothetical protein D3C80_366510 [compost metagenome]
MVAEHADHLLAFTKPHQAMVDVNAGELVADRLMDENSRNRGIDAARECAEHAAGADLLADLADHLGAISRHRPVGFKPDDLVHEVGEQLAAVRGMHHFRVEHGGVVVTGLVRGDGERRVLGGCDDLETFRQLRYTVAMAHPDGIALALFPEAFKKRACLLDVDIGPAEFRRMAALDNAAELRAERLLAVADAEDRNLAVKHRLRRARASFRRHGCGAAGEDHALGLKLLKRLCGILKRMDFAIDPGFADAARNQLRHLAAEIDDENAVGMGYLGHGEPLKKMAALGNPEAGVKQRKFAKIARFQRAIVPSSMARQSPSTASASFSSMMCRYSVQSSTWFTSALPSEIPRRPASGTPKRWQARSTA